MFNTDIIRIRITYQLKCDEYYEFNGYKKYEKVKDVQPIVMSW